MAEPSLARLSALFFGFLLLLATYSWVPGLHSGYLSGTGVRKTLGPDLKLRVDHSSAKPHHPLDPLTVQEIERVRAILLDHEPGFGSGSATIHSMALDEPDKKRVVKWKKGNRLPSRRAEVLALSSGQSHVIIVDLDSGRVVSDVVNPTSGYPILTMDDLIVASQVSQNSFIGKRHVTDLVFRLTLSPVNRFSLPVNFRFNFWPIRSTRFPFQFFWYSTVCGFR